MFDYSYRFRLAQRLSPWLETTYDSNWALLIRMAGLRGIVAVPQRVTERAGHVVMMEFLDDLERGPTRLPKQPTCHPLGNLLRLTLHQGQRPEWLRLFASAIVRHNLLVTADHQARLGTSSPETMVLADAIENDALPPERVEEAAHLSTNGRLREGSLAEVLWQLAEYADEQDQTTKLARFFALLLPTPPAVNPQPNPLPRTPKKEQYYILFAIHPQLDKDRGEKYRLEGWLFREGEDDKEPEPVIMSDVPMRIREIEELFGQTVRQAILSKRAPHTVLSFTIGICLPADLINVNVDHWCADFNSENSVERVSLRYALVIRLLKRAYDPVGSTYSIWAAFWQRIMSDPRAVISVCTLSEFPGPNWDSEIHNILLLKHGGKSEFTERHPLQGDFVERLLRSGIPIALWTRHEQEVTPRPGESFNDVVTSVPLMKLPEKVRQMRFSINDDNDYWASVTLLWDDADRLPANSPLSPFSQPLDSTTMEGIE